MAAARLPIPSAEVEGTLSACTKPLDQLGARNPTQLTILDGLDDPLPVYLSRLQPMVNRFSIRVALVLLTASWVLGAAAQAVTDGRVQPGWFGFGAAILVFWWNARSVWRTRRVRGGTM